MIDATEILPKGIRLAWNGIKRDVQVNYDGKRFFRAAPFVIYVSSSGEEYQFEKETWVQLNKEGWYSIKNISRDNFNFDFDVEQIVDKHSVSCGDSFHEWKKFKPFMSEDMGGTMRDKHLDFDIHGYFSSLGLDILILHPDAPRTIPQVKINGVRCGNDTLMDYRDCFKVSFSQELEVIGHCYVSSYDEAESLVELLLLKHKELSSASRWEYTYNQIKDGHLTLEQFVQNIVGEKHGSK